MKRSIPTLLALALVCSVRAQPTFEKFYQSATSYTLDLIELPGHHLMTCMAATHVIDPEGYIVHSSSYREGGTYLTQSLDAAGSNTVYFTTATRPTECTNGAISLIYPVLGRMDSLGATASMRRYALEHGTCYNSPGGLEVTNDLGAITWGREKNFFALRVAEDFSPVWAKQVVRSGGFRFLKELPGGDLLAGINMDTAGAVVARLDPNGNFIWSKSYIRPKGVVHDAIIESDDSFIITGFTETTNTSIFVPLPSTYHPKLFMMKLNGDGEVQWCRGYDSAPHYWHVSTYSRIERTLDGNYVILATLGLPDYNFEFRPLLMKTDINGDTLWTRSIGRNGFRYKTSDLATLSDGGLLFSGLIFGDLPGGNSGLPYIYKSDENGRLPCWERVHAIQPHDLFPVDSNFTLATVDIPTVATPILVEDTIFQPFTVYDGCTFTTGMPPDMRSSTRRMNVRPNPNTGRFTVEFQDPLVRDSYYSVYDSMGKLLFQRAAAHGQKTEEVDLTGYAKGSYVIRFTDPDGTCYERVVLE